MLKQLQGFSTHWAAGVALSALIGLTAAPASAQTLSLAGVRDSSLPQNLYDTGTIFTPGYYDQVQFLNGTGVAVASTINGSARAQSDYGVNRVEAASFAPVDDELLRQTSIGGPFADAFSVWADRFVVQGGTGVGTLSVSAIVSGQFGAQPGGFGFYDLMVVDSGDAAADARAVAAILRDESGPDTLLATSVLSLAQEVPAPGFTTDVEALTPGAAFGRVLAGQVTFTYGRPFYLVSVLGASANDFGSLSAFNSAHFGITAPTGAAIVSDAGVNYAAAVPEPSTALMALVACLGLAGWRSRRSA